MTLVLAWGAIVLLATYLTFIGGAWAGIYLAPLRLLTMIAAAAVLTAWLIAAIRSPSWRPRSVLMPAILVSLGSLAISTVFSRVPRVSLEYLGYAIVLAALYMLLVRLMAHPFLGRRVRSLAPLFFAVISGAFLLLVLGHWIDWWGLVGRFAIPPLRPNFEGLTYLNPSAVLTMTVLFGASAAALFDPATRGGRWALVAIGLIVAIVAFLTGSRAGWLAIALTLAVVVVVVLVDRERRTSIRAAVAAALGKGRVRAIAGIAALVLVVGTIAFTPAIVRRLSEGGEDARAQFAESALRMWATSPLVGTGPGTWVIQRLAQTNGDETDSYIPHAHNLEVQTLAELGLVGAAAGLIVFLAVSRLIVGGLRDRDPLRQRFAWFSLAGMTYFGLHQLLDFYANMPAVLFAAALPVAFLDATAPPRRGNAPADLARVSAGTHRILGPVAAVLLAASITGLVLQEAPALQAAAAVEMADRDDWDRASIPARGVADQETLIGSYALTAGLAAARGGDHHAAIGYFSRVANRDDLPEAWLNLAAEQLELGRNDEARASLDRAIRLGGQRPAIAMGVADLAIRLGAADLAANAATSAIAGNPTIASDPWWSEDADRRTALSSAVRQIMAFGDPDLGWPIALMLGDIAGARSMADASEAAELAHLVIDGWAGNSTSIDALMDRCDGSPLDATALTWCARIAARAGHPAEASRMRDLLEVLSPGGSANAGILRVTSAGDEASVASGGHAINWGTFTYRRATPRDMLIPSVVHLMVQ